MERIVNEKQRKVIEAARAKEPRFLEIDTPKKSKVRRFTAFENMVSRMTPKRQAELHARQRAADAEKERLALAEREKPATHYPTKRKHKPSPELLQEQKRIWGTFHGSKKP